MPNGEPPRTDVLQGTFDLMVLQTLDSLGPVHGYAIAGRLEPVSTGALRVNIGTRYPALMRLEQRGFCVAAGERRTTIGWRRCCALTPARRRRLAKENHEWNRMVAIMHTLLRGEA